MLTLVSSFIKTKLCLVSHSFLIFRNSKYPLCKLHVLILIHKLIIFKFSFKLVLYLLTVLHAVILQLNCVVFYSLQSLINKTNSYSFHYCLRSDLIINMFLCQSISRCFYLHLSSSPSLSFSFFSPPPPPSLCLFLMHTVNALGQEGICVAAESHREFVSPRAELQNSTGFRSASQQDGGMIGYK